MAKTLHFECRQSWSDLIPGQGTRSPTPQVKILHATTKTQFSQINYYFKKSLVQRYWISKSGEAQILLPYPILQIFIIFHKTFTGICLVKEELAH